MSTYATQIKLLYFEVMKDQQSINFLLIRQRYFCNDNEVIVLNYVFYEIQHNIILPKNILKA